VVQSSHKKILVCPLDWGLGHAARTIPLIHALQGYDDCEIILGVSGISGELLKSEFPTLQTVPFPSAHIRYSKGKNQVFCLMAQLPRFLGVVWKEHQLLKKLVKRHGLSAVISDNRYGLYHRSIPSVLLIHQVNLILPRGMKLAERMVNFWHHRWFRKFDQVWIPDLPGLKNVAGRLSQIPSKLNHLYPLGILSRFFYGQPAAARQEGLWDMVVVLSGPEPQKSMLAEVITRQLKERGSKALLVRGEPGSRHSYHDGNITVVSHMPGEELHQHMKAAHLVVCRSGYSSVMDLIALGKQAILIPTPGQPEQEYLARHLFEKGWFYYERQQTFNLSKALANADGFAPPRMAVSDGLFKRVNWLYGRLKEQEGKQ
jgi:predicted glycosyltransferase